MQKMQDKPIYAGGGFDLCCVDPGNLAALKAAFQDQSTFAIQILAMPNFYPKKG